MGASLILMLRIGAAETVRGLAWVARGLADGGFGTATRLYAIADRIEGR